MRPAYAAEQIRAAEAAVMAGLPAGTLMSRAATALARRVALLLGKVYGARVVLLIGSGNNGADALWAGAFLARRGARVTALLAGTADPAAAGALGSAGGRLVPAGAATDGELLVTADVVVDGLVGIGGKGPLREPAARLVRLAGSTAAVVVAVDVPSGVDADSGRVAGVAVRAAVTVTFGALKPGLLIAPGAQYAGVVECVDIGLGPELPPPDAAPVGALDAADVVARLPRPEPEATKYTRGVVGVAAGSEVYPGAAVLAVGGAVRGGAGMVRFAGPPHAAERVRQQWPEAVVTEARTASEALNAGRVQAWVAGPGMGTGADAAEVLAAILLTELPVLIDADGLTVLAGEAALRQALRRRPAPTLLTPHAGELSRLTGAPRADLEADRLAAVRKAADSLGCTVLLKGSTTVVAEPGRPVRVNTTGTPELATAGSGDVLSGACGALLAAGLSPLDAGSCGAFLHGLAGRLAAGGPATGVAPIAASDLLETWPAAVRAVTADHLPAAGPPTAATGRRA